MSSAWPMIERSAVRQWHGLEEDERAYFEAVIARRDHYDLGGCISGSDFVTGQIVRPIWTARPAIGNPLDLVAIKEDLP